MPDILGTPEYAKGKAWVRENYERVAELFSSGKLLTQDLRGYLFGVAGRAYPSQRESMENEMKQTGWVAGAIRSLVDRMPPEAAGDVAETAIEMGAYWNAEYWSEECLKELKEKPRGWWQTKFGDATPNDVIGALSHRWWDEIGSPQKRKRTSKWEILIYTTGTREICVLADLESIEHIQERYERYRVHSDDKYFEVMAAPVWDGRILLQEMGAIVG